MIYYKDIMMNQQMYYTINDDDYMIYGFQMKEFFLLTIRCIISYIISDSGHR